MRRFVHTIPARSSSVNLGAMMNNKEQLAPDELRHFAKGARVMPDGQRIPQRQDKHGKLYLRADVDAAVVKKISCGSYFYLRAKRMVEDAEKATKLTDKVVDDFGRSLDRFLEMEARLSSESKRVSGSVRDAAEKLSQGLARIEKAADADKLTRVVELLERAAAAMQSLAELEKGGKLERIAQAIRS
jgi:hypothetical protein